MAKIHFYYGAMNASKTTLLINNADNYQRSGLKPIVIKPSRAFRLKSIMMCTNCRSTHKNLKEDATINKT